MENIWMDATCPQSRNTSTANYSAILGGCGNNDGGLQYAGIFGCNVTAVNSCAFHANNFVAQNIASVNAVGWTFLQPGTLYIDSSVAPAFAANQVFIKI